jgi:uncharacterized protein (UPF0212 family)
MTPASAVEHLAAWERVHPSSPAQRPAALADALGITRAHTIGARNAALLDIYAQRFGDRLDGVSACPSCGAEVELGLTVEGIKKTVPQPQPVEPLTVGADTVVWRIPDDDDLVAALGAFDGDRGALALFRRCVVSPDQSSSPLSDEVRAAIAEHIAAADPYADLTVELVCPACSEHWDSVLDVAEFLWAAINSDARRLLREVDELASAYGWSEAQILELSQHRRDVYLDLIRNG